ncbi:MAG: YidC/Oxa1 family membrane protein insertase [Solirubrobacterales bacterium]|nr:YidC/Oxa1 family membrane protein insertase [Solirubrobacterales bacterium]
MTPLLANTVANILQPLIDVASSVLNTFHGWGLSWGMAIILLTIVTRALLIPLTFKQIKSMRALQAFQPQIKALQEKYKNDRQRLSQEMMKFYQENKINPLASCIPLLAQMPIFITLFWTLKGPLREDMCGQTAKACGDVLNPATGHLGGFGESFLFIPDLTAKATGIVLIVLMVLYAGTQLISGLITATSSDRNQRIMMFVLPFIFIPFIISFPAGLVLYWITTNFWTIGQQAVVNKVIPPPVLPSPAEAAAVKAPPPPPRKKKRRR